jgi:ketosteroid isomerase-like protein
MGRVSEELHLGWLGVGCHVRGADMSLPTLATRDGTRVARIRKNWENIRKKLTPTLGLAQMVTRIAVSGDRPATTGTGDCRDTGMGSKKLGTYG